MSWQSHRTAPQSGWFLVTNKAMASRGYVEIAKRDRRRKGQYFVRRCGSLIFVEKWAPIPDLPVFSPENASP